MLVVTQHQAWALCVEGMCRYAPSNQLFKPDQHGINLPLLPAACSSEVCWEEASGWESA